MTTRPIDLEADPNCEDDEGRRWSVLDWSIDPSKIVPGAIVIAGDGPIRALVRIDQADDDGPVHLVGATQPNETTLGGIRTVASMYQRCTSTPVDSGEQRGPAGRRKPRLSRQDVPQPGVE